MIFSADAQDEEYFGSCTEETGVQTDPCEDSHDLEEHSCSTLDVSLHSHYSDYEYDDDYE